MNKTIKNGEYKTRGDYHKELDKNWCYYPIYLAKLEFIKKYLQRTSKQSKILDAGCGEGVLVEKYQKEGYNIIGLDLNYSSEYVLRGDISKMPFKNGEFDVVLCLDIIEHLNFKEQEKALNEVNRVLNNDGSVILAIPNLAHLASRISFLFTGELIRTSTIDRHKGDRPIKEYLEIIYKAGLKIIKRKGIFPTFPISSLLTYMFPSRVMGLHITLNMLFSYPNWCFLNIMICKKLSSNVENQGKLNNYRDR
jgi:SAM-dependent methyltransferase